MTNRNNKHENYEILNLIGYGLSKFNDDFIKEFGFTTLQSFYKYCVTLGIAKTENTIKNRRDLLDPFFPENGRVGYQRGNTYIHRKMSIDSLFGDADVSTYASIIKLYLQDNFGAKDLAIKHNPIVKSKFKQMQKTGLEAELFFINNFNSVHLFNGGKIEDARLYGDGYDFQITLNDHFFLVEVKGIREKKGDCRLTQKEHQRASEYQDQYVLSVVFNLVDIPKICPIINPLKNLHFKKVEVTQKIKVEYRLTSAISINDFHTS